MSEQGRSSWFEDALSKIPELSEAQRAQLEKALGLRGERIRATIRELQGSLDQLRLSVKYLVFDLEATRRENTTLRAENSELRRLLEERE
ncbi:MAG: hypothetical protein KDD64_03965 [Bdellovibrionales bacterium]|nr:hypothetical protein [Bdellovibrionales bacterium]